MLQNGSKGDDVARLQRALNMALGRVPPLRPDGGFGQLTEAAVMEFQHKFRLVPDGKVSDELMGLITATAVSQGWLEKPEPGGPAPWLELAKGELGQKEVQGLGANSRILDYIATFPYLAQITAKGQPLMMSQTDETAWCACFVNWCLLRSGQRHGASARAEDWLSYGTALETPVPGAICVIFNPGLGASTTASGWHVGFWTGKAKDGATLLGGNQGNSVSEAPMKGTIKGYRWPG